ncbi:NAD(P)/FAD-dependent oxidoreductase [Bradyrhizobium sp. CCBAU 51765]|uniref:NAD(P)/FAD-dependent oxidoreductase n=1 Tax=Bradyrhizobium sp. CCBAU 51765 TaxID=1325102 RepID=UPI001889502A|nr:FAD-dependent monooxygenase [Bradyrhizobium sp. CCBAU 51765]QOZ11655.1 FAD-dependent oxidoreductase [Bradyrhizobium sp. CCBAU 51765]
MKSDADIIVVGGGPAGSAAAIHARQSGLTVIVIEADGQPRRRPGETLHSGAASILEQLGVREAFEHAIGGRYGSIQVEWSTARSSDRGSIPLAAASGFHIFRDKLDAVLIERAETLSADVRRPCRALRPIVRDQEVVGVETDSGPLEAPFVIDASGNGNWFRKSYPSRVDVLSPRLLARYGYCRVDDLRDFGSPSIKGDQSGWQWIARVSDDTLAWVSLALPGASARPVKPTALAALTDVSPTRGADVTWKRADAYSGPGFFLVGDAAFQLDPAAGHGILRAMMSGIMATYQAAAAIKGRVGPDEAAQLYRGWMAEWWRRDTSALTEMYLRLDATWDRSSSTREHHQSEAGA